jgi:UDP-N-acetylglucosamine transferase subunit ALG13
MPFERLVRAVDEWAAQRGEEDVFAQIGSSDYRPRHIRWTRFLDPDAFQDQMSAADVIVGHAGTGTILEALRHGKHVVVLPRQGALRETRDDHQFDTAEALGNRSGVYVAKDEADLGKLLEQALASPPPEILSGHASPELIEAIRSFLDQCRY